MKILSEYHGDRSIRQALVYEEDGKFFVRQIEDGNIVYTAKFNYRESAQEFAEEWALEELSND